MGNLRIIRMTNRDDAFYGTMGPFLSRRAIVKELGYPVWDDDEKLWWVALDGDDVRGWCAARPERLKVVLTSAYVLPEHRRHGVYRALFGDRLCAMVRGFAPLPIESTVTVMSAPLFEQNGFTRVRTRGHYTLYRLEFA